MIRGRIASVGYALAGLWLMLRTQPNARIHVAATLVVCGLGAWCGLARQEWALLLLAIALVWIAETLNTAIELLADAAVPEHNTLIKHAKDVAAGAVLLASLIAVVIGVLVFLPCLTR